MSVAGRTERSGRYHPARRKYSHFTITVGVDHKGAFSKMAGSEVIDQKCTRHPRVLWAWKRELVGTSLEEVLEILLRVIERTKALVSLFFIPFCWFIVRACMCICVWARDSYLPLFAEWTVFRFMRRKKKKKLRHQQLRALKKWKKQMNKKYVCCC